MSDILELAKKLKALADRGVGGEKANAESKLRAVMDKHGISESDLLGIDRKTRFFTVPLVYANIFAHVVWSVRPDAQLHGVERGGRKRRNRYAADLSDAEFIEVQTFFEIYRDAYEKEIDMLRTAFILKNNLEYTGPSQTKSKPLTREEKRKLANMMEGVTEVSRAKALIE